MWEFNQTQYCSWVFANSDAGRWGASPHRWTALHLQRCSSSRLQRCPAVTPKPLASSHTRPMSAPRCGSDSTLQYLQHCSSHWRLQRSRQWSAANDRSRPQKKKMPRHDTSETRQKERSSALPPCQWPTQKQSPTTTQPNSKNTQDVPTWHQLNFEVNCFDRLYVSFSWVFSLFVLCESTPAFWLSTN